MNNIKIIYKKKGKPKNIILGCLEKSKDDNQNMGWDCAKKKWQWKELKFHRQPNVTKTT